MKIWFSVSILTIISLIINGCIINTENNEKLKTEFDINKSEAKRITNGEKSLPYSLKAYEIASKLNSEKDIAASCIEISHDYEKLGDLSLALKYTIKAANIYVSLNEKNRIALTYNRIGTLYFNQGDTVLSIQYLEKALAIHKEIGKDIYIGEDLGNIGEVYRLLGDYKKAINYLHNSIKFISETEYTTQFAYTNGNLGLAYLSLGKLDSANFYLDKSKKLLYQLGDNYPITTYLIEDAKLLYEKGKYNNALQKTQQSIELSTKEGFVEQTAHGYELLSKIQKGKRNFKDALYAYEKYRVLNDSLSNIGLVREMERQRTDFEVSKREETIQVLEKVNKLRNTIILIMAIGIVLIALSALSYFKLYGKLKLVNGELEIKNNIIEEALHEKEALLKEIHHRVKNNLQIISSLLSLQSRQLNDEKAKIAIENSQNRLQSISLIHQKLYQSNNIAYIKAQEYVEQLMTELHNAFFKESIIIQHKLDIENLNLNMDVMVPLGLIINELTINAYKYAFVEKGTGTIEIKLKKKVIDNNNYQLSFKDNGIGLPNDVNPLKASSLGLKLVSILSRQLGGELSYNASNGSEFILNFNVKNNQQN